MNIQVDGLSVHYKESGTGERVVVILQGWLAPCEVYDSIAALLSSHYRVIQLDVPGLGASDEPRDPWDLNAYADFFLRFMDALGIGSATLIGHSWGGRVIIKLAARETLPFTIERIVLVDGAGIPRKRTPAEERRIRRYKVMKRVVELPLIAKSFPDLIEAWRDAQGSADYRASSPTMRATMVMSINEDLTPLLERVAPEVLLVWGADDEDTPLSDGQLMEQKMPNASLAVIEGAGHFSFLDQPVVFAGIMRAYFGLEG